MSAPMTEAEMWQKAFDGVIGQGALAKDSEICYYRMSDDGGRILKCGVGHLIDDAEAERLGFSAIWDAIPNGETPSWMTPHKRFLSDIREAHDGAENLDEFREKMLAIKPEVE